MKIGILSDIHDNVWNLRGSLTALREVDALICCGDLCSPFIVGLLAAGLPDRPIHIVFGNNDGDHLRIAQMATKWPQVQLHGEVFVGEIGGKRIAVNHYPSIAATIDRQSYDLICYGHDHRFKIARHGAALVINPGPIMGYESGEAHAFAVEADGEGATPHRFTIEEG